MCVYVCRTLMTRNILLTINIVVLISAMFTQQTLRVLELESCEDAQSDRLPVRYMPAVSLGMLCQPSG